MALKRVYLDQWDWITLARQHYGLTRDDGIAGVLALVREAARWSIPHEVWHEFFGPAQREIALLVYSGYSSRRTSA